MKAPHDYYHYYYFRVLLFIRPHLNQFEECKTSLREGPRWPRGHLGGSQGSLGPQAPWCPLEPPGSLPQSDFTLLKLVKMRPDVAIIRQNIKRVRELYTNRYALRFFFNALDTINEYRKHEIGHTPYMLMIRL